MAVARISRARRVLHSPIACLTGLLAALPAAAQQSQEPPAIGLLSHTYSRELTYRVQVQAVDVFRYNDHAGRTLPHQQLSRLIIAFPLLEFTSTFEARDEGFTSVLRVDDHVVDDQADLIPLYQAGTRLARWDAEGELSTDFYLEFEQTSVSHSLEFDEAAAMEIDWPDRGWPPIAATALQPQFFVDVGAPALQQRLTRWAGRNPQRMAPARLAKTLAARVVNEFRVLNNLALETSSAGGIGGYQVVPASLSAQRLEGSSFDISVLLCGLYRQAGLPARVVIGYDMGESAEGADEIEARDNYAVCQLPDRGDVPFIPIVRAWVEFYLYDEDAGQGEWIPVDVERQQQVSSRARPLDRPWEFFGNMPCGDLLVPLSFHFVPPTTVASPGAPAMWGWLGFPVTPRIEHNFNVAAWATPKTAGD